MTPEEIKALRLRLSLSQQAFAEELGGFSLQTIANWEHGRAKPSRANLRRLEELAEQSRKGAKT